MPRTRGQTDAAERIHEGAASAAPSPRSVRSGRRSAVDFPRGPERPILIRATCALSVGLAVWATGEGQARMRVWGTLADQAGRSADARVTPLRSACLRWFRRAG
jgi:hypothetical protein